MICDLFNTKKSHCQLLGRFWLNDSDPQIWQMLSTLVLCKQLGKYFQARYLGWQFPSLLHLQLSIFYSFFPIISTTSPVANLTMIILIFDHCQAIRFLAKICKRFYSIIPLHIMLFLFLGILSQWLVWNHRVILSYLVGIRFYIIFSDSSYIYGDCMAS